MCPNQDLLDRLSLGLLSEEELTPLEEHLETCERCRRTLSESDASDTVIEALREGPRTLQRRSEIEDDIRRVEAAFLARLRDPYRTQPETGRQSKAAEEVGGETSASDSGHSTMSPTPLPRTEPDGDDDSYNFLSPALTADEIGRLGPYRVLRTLGSGGMGVVFEAEDTQLLRHVALKVMKPGVATNLSARKRFLREARTAASVEHDHIVPIYQVGEEHGVPFIAMPLLRGQTLAERLDSVGNGLRAVPPAGTRGMGEGRLNYPEVVEPIDDRSPHAPRGVTNHGERGAYGGQATDASPNPKSKIENPKSLRTPELARVGRELALGLAAAHRRGLIHRDIKPSNIWLEEETGRVKILDFGLARAADGGEQLTHSGSLLGTPAYMSPEQAGGGVADARSDLFSLGCVLYHAATGRRPFFGRDTLSTLVAVTTTEPPAPRELNPSLPAELNDLVVALLSKDPAGRPQTAREVAERLVGWASPTVARAPALVRGETSPAADVADQQSVGNGLRAVPPAADVAILPLPPAPQASAPRHGEGALNRVPASTVEHLPAHDLVGNAHPTRPPRRGLLMLASAAAAAALLAGVLITIKNREGKVVATVQTKDRADVVIDPEHTAEIKPGPDDDTNLKPERGEEDPKASEASARPTPAENVAPKPQDLSPKTALPNPKSKIENPKSPEDAPPPAIAPFDAEQARQHQQAWADYLKLPLEHTNSVGMKFILIPPGEFTMGSTQLEIQQALKDVGEDKHWQECIKSEAPQHKVVLTRPFYLAVHEVTQKEYEAVMGVNPSHFSKTGPDEKAKQQLADLDTSNHPVETVSWNDAAEFCAKLSKQEELKPFYFRAGETVTALKGTGYRLPTEAEWEFACRAGTTTKFWNGDDLPAGWFGGNSGGRTHEVEELADNPFGLFDVHGNVWEWVEDSWDPTFYARFTDKPAVNPNCPFSAGARRVLRGGDWCVDASYCRSAYRFAFDPSYRDNLFGFRVVLVAASLRASR